MRLRRVRFKNGMTVDVIGNREAEPVNNAAGRVLRAARYAVSREAKGSQLDGYVVIGMFNDGCTTLGYMLPDRIPRALAIGYLSEIMRRDMIMETEARAVFDEKFEWVE